MQQIDKVDKVIPIRVSSLNDLARMAASVAALGQPTYVLKYREEGGKVVYGILAVFRDFYKYYGVPLFYYYVSDKDVDGSYLIVRTDESGERVEISKGSKPGWISIPIIQLSEKPPFIP